MPVEFVRQDENCKTSVCDSTKLVLRYDGSGRRVSKTRLMKSAADSDWLVYHITHYTGIGTEVRENYNGGSTPETKVVMNLPEGLGRYMPEDAVDGLNGVSGDQLAGYRPPAKFEWYLKNHLGSTMLVYGTSAYNDPLVSGYKDGVKAAYDYRAFGEQVDLAMPTDKVTENFTGKEKDDETELNYFGARYLDPMIGLWTSVDAARQYDSPYTYAGNNPIIVTDPDGLWGFSASVGIKGAVIAGGLFNLSINYDSERPEANKVMLTVGYGVGIDVGLTKLKFKMFNKALSKVEPVNAGPSDKDPETGWHSQIDASLGIIPIQGSFKDEVTTPSSYGLGVGGGYYDTYTVDLGKFFNDKTETIRNETLEDQADINNIDLDSN